MVGLTINGKDAKAAFGITLDETSLGTLMTPPPMKERVTSRSRIENGVRVITDATTYVDSRDLTLQVNISAKTESDFLAKYAAFCAERHIPLYLSLMPAVQPVPERNRKVCVKTS